MIKTPTQNYLTNNDTFSQLIKFLRKCDYAHVKRSNIFVYFVYKTDNPFKGARAMNKKIITFSVLATSAMIMTVVLGAKNNFGFLVFGQDVNDFSFALNGSTNVLDSNQSSGVFRLSDPLNTIDVTYAGYSHVSQNNWGTLTNNGYFQVANNSRVGGITNISYHADGELTLEFGYMECNKPTYYSAYLPSEKNSFSFPENKGYPDTFKISNTSGSDVTIQDMIFFYTCSQTDEHSHVVLDDIFRDTSGAEIKYYKQCDICGEQTEVRFDDYKVKIGTSSSDLVEYTPYNYTSYANASRAGTLDFDYNSTLNSEKRFVLTLNGDESSKNIYIDSNFTRASQIVIKSNAPSSINNITFKGGYGVLVFMGEQLSFADGATLNTEAIYCSVKGPLVFTKTGARSGEAIYLNNGCLVLENDVSISGYKRGIRVYQSVTGTKDIQQSSGTLTITNCDDGIRSCSNSDSTQPGPYSPTLIVKGTVNMTNVKVGTHFCSVQVGDANNAGALMIDADKTDSSASNPSACIWLMRSSATVNFVNGKAALYSSNTATDWTDANWGEWDSGSPDTPNGSYTIGIKMTVTESSDTAKLQWNSSFKFGLGNLARGFDNTGGSNVTSFFGPTGIRSCDFHTYHLCDSAWGLSSKPVGGNNTQHSSLSDFLSAF